MKGLIRKEWYSLWSQYRIHMLAMLGLGVLLPFLKDTDFFLDESFWIYCAVITIFYILMHSVEYEKTSKWDIYRATFPIKGREIVVSKYIFGFGIVMIASILVFAGSMICQKMIAGRINIHFIGRVVKAIWINGTLNMILAFPILCRYGYDKGRLPAAIIVSFLGMFYPYKLQQLLLNLPFPTIAFLILLFIIWCFSGVLSCKLYEKRNDQ